MDRLYPYRHAFLVLIPVGGFLVAALLQAPTKPPRDLPDVPPEKGVRVELGYPSELRADLSESEPVDIFDSGIPYGRDLLNQAVYQPSEDDEVRTMLAKASGMLRRLPKTTESIEDEDASQGIQSNIDDQFDVSQDELFQFAGLRRLPPVTDSPQESAGTIESVLKVPSNDGMDLAPPTAAEEVAEGSENRNDGFEGVAITPLPPVENELADEEEPVIRRNITPLPPVNTDLSEDSNFAEPADNGLDSQALPSEPNLPLEMDADQTARLPGTEESEIVAPHVAADESIVPLPPVGNTTSQPTTEMAKSRPGPRPNDGMKIVGQRAEALAQRGMSLAGRGAVFSAEAAFHQSLRLIAQSLDVAQGTREHSAALAAGLRAMEEAEDFAPRDGHLDSKLLGDIILGHRTPVLQEADVETLSPVVALQQYFTYAREQFSKSCGNVPAATSALYGLGRLQSEIVDADRTALAGPKAIAFYQAAVLIRPEDVRSANELGVMLAQYGQWQGARRVLQSGAARAARPYPEVWQNLAAVHRHLGESDLAKRAEYEAQLASQSNATKQAASLQWVSPQVFAQQNPEAAGPPVAREAKRPQAATQPAPEPEKKKSQRQSSFRFPWPFGGE